MTTPNVRRADVLSAPHLHTPGGSNSRRAGRASAPNHATPAEQDPRPTMKGSVPNWCSSDASISRSARTHVTAEAATPSGPSSPAAIRPPTPPDAAPQETPATKKLPAPTNLASRGTKSAGRRVPSDTHGTDAAGFNSRSANLVASSNGSSPSGLNVPDPTANAGATPRTLSLLDPALALAADVLDDIERVRIANENRIRQLTRTGEDEDGEERGFGLDPDHPDVLRIAVMVHVLQGLEHDATLELQRKLRKHPLGAWMKTQRGIGEKQGARLLAAIGDPYINSAKGQPRTVSALWAYAGLHVLPAVDHGRIDDQGRSADSGDQLRDTDQIAADAHVPSVGVAAKRRKGQRANWSSKAKMRAYLIAESCMKTGRSPDCRDGHIRADSHITSAVPACACSPYRLVYESRRAHTAVTHPDWSDGHSHNDALRVVSKEVLKQLWRAAREWHIGGER